MTGGGEGPCAQHKVSSPGSGPAKRRGGMYPHPRALALRIHPGAQSKPPPQPAEASEPGQKLRGAGKALPQPSHRLGLTAQARWGPPDAVGVPYPVLPLPPPASLHHAHPRLRKRGASRSVPNPQSCSLQRPGEGSSAFPQSLASSRWRWNPDLRIFPSRDIHLKGGALVPKVTAGFDRLHKVFAPREGRRDRVPA